MEDKILFTKEINYHTTYFHLPFNEITFLDSLKKTKKPKYGLFQFTHETNTEKDFIENYGNKVCSVYKEHYKIEVKRSGDKLSVRYFVKFFSRKAGVHYFKKQYNFHFFTINLKTYDVYLGHLLNHQNKRKYHKSIIKNPFNYPGSIKVFFEKINKKLMDGFEIDFFHILNTESNSEFKSINELNHNIIEKNLKLRKVKVPNNLNVFLSNYETFPDSKTLRKFGNKFVDAYMFKNLLKGKHIKKLLHEVNYINIPGFKSAIDLFGYDLLYRKNMLKKFLEMENVKSYYGVFPSNLTTKETETILSYFGFVLDDKMVISTLADHIRFYVGLKAFRNDIKFNAKNLEQFHEEHIEFSDLFALYTKYLVNRKYPKEFVDKIGEPIYSNDGSIYYPVLLKNSSDYNNESAIQNNCVKNYVEYANSIIVSLRRGTNISPDRLTIEYQVSYDNDTKKLYVRNAQCLSKFNRLPNTSWNVPVEIMDGIMSNAINSSEFSLEMTKEYGERQSERFTAIIPKDKTYMGPDLKIMTDLEWDKQNEKIESFFENGLFI
jgi:hypothetical protein